MAIGLMKTGMIDKIRFRIRRTPAARKRRFPPREDYRAVCHTWLVEDMADWTGVPFVCERGRATVHITRPLSFATVPITADPVAIWQRTTLKRAIHTQRVN